MRYLDNYIDPNKKTKMRGNDRAFVLELIDDKLPISSTGLVDKRLFNGENRIHAIRDEGSNNLWYFKYDHGALPDKLGGKRFTKFELANKYLEEYFRDRNVRVKEVID